MATQKPRLNVVLEEPLYFSIQRLATKDKVSMSLKARDLIKEALEIYEDDFWLRRAKERDKTFDVKKAMGHEEVWK